jgi:membrane-bound inhibitor of C-type lysozyme
MTASRMVLLTLAATWLGAGPSPAFAQTVATYHCSDGGDFVASFYPDRRRLSAKVDGRNILLTRRLSLSGLRYVSGDISVRIKGQVATLTRGRRSTNCTAE